MPLLNRHRILMAVTSLGKWGEISGVAYTHQNFLRQLAKKNVAIDAIAYGPRDNCQKIGSVRVFTLRPKIPIKVDAKLTIDLLITPPQLNRLLGDFSYTVVHNAAPDALGFAAISIARKNNCPLVSIYHTALDEYARLRVEKIFGNGIARLSAEIMKQILAMHYNQADLILAPSRYFKDLLTKKYSPPVEILGRGVDPFLFSPDWRSRRRAGKVEAIYVGRVASEKNLDILSDIFAARPHLGLKVIGDGPYLGRLRTKMTGAKYSGALFGRKLSRAFANGDIFVFPSLTETFGNVTLQAMASGLPVVVMDKMASAEIVRHGVNGFVCSNEREFAAAIDLLARDKDLRRRMSLSGRSFALTQSWEKICQQLLDYYDLAAQIKNRRQNDS